VRQDYSIEAWQAPPAEALGWWKSQIPTAETKKTQWAPNDVMLELFDELAGQPDRSDLRYVLTLLLIRRRVFRLEETERDSSGRQTLLVYCPRRQTDYKVPVAMPDGLRAQQSAVASALCFSRNRVRECRRKSNAPVRSPLADPCFRSISRFSFPPVDRRPWIAPDRRLLPRRRL
jgi:hypothetical protein